MGALLGMTNRASRGARPGAWPVAALAALLLAASCATPRPPQPAAVPAAAEARPSGRVAFRMKLGLSDGRALRAGVAWVLAGEPAVAVTAANVVPGALGGARLVSLDLADGASGEPVGAVVGLAAPPGAGFDGLDYSKGVAFLAIATVPEDAARLALAARRATEGQETRIVGCPADSSAPEQTVAARVVLASATRLELDVDPAEKLRGFAGSPVLSEAGEVVGMVQNVVRRGGRGLVLATPAEAIAAARPHRGGPAPPLPLSSWTAR